MKLNKFIGALLLTLLGSANLFAGNITPGKVYRIRNAGKTSQSMAVSASVQGAVTSVTSVSDLKQQWYITANEEGTGYYLRNVFNGAYLASPKMLYTQWPVSFVTTPDAGTMLMSIAQNENNNWLIKAKSHTDSHAYAHSDGSNNIVCWSYSDNLNSQWKFEEVNMTDDEIQAMLDRFKSTGDEIAKASEYERHLDALFSDKACTTLKVNGDLSQNADYLALSPTLRSMVDKVESDNWQETKGDWDDTHARKYRVQLYEPYSEGSAAAGMAGIQAYTNMNNPTGILADAGDIVYVMVDGDVKEGATLYIGGVPDNNMYNSVTSGTPLHKGLNMVMCNANNTHYFIYYTVNTVKDKKPYYNLNDFKPLKIHIEGGRLNGFFNYVGDELYKGDTREDYEYTSKRATHPMYDLMGKYVILHFFLEDTPNTPEETTKQLGVKSSLDPTKNTGTDKRYDPVQIMKTWDGVCFAERILMGIQNDSDVVKPFNQGNYSTIVGDRYEKGGYVCNLDFQYSDYFNNRMMGITLQAKGLYMNATAWRTAYAPSTISAILTELHKGSWGPAHEYGHMNQTPMRIAGTTEVSNNVFSNVALYYGENSTTSRCDYMSNQLKIFNQGKTYLENGTWGTTRMFWQLWCYYHATKHNTKFYPRLYELLRHYPLKRTLDTNYTPAKLYAKTDMLHFAKMCCVAAGEDLTDFFTAWGFFVPMDNYHIDDYDVYDCILSQEDIDEVKREIAEMKLPKNNAILLIDDRPGSEKPDHSEFKKAGAGELGGLKAFTEGAVPSGKFNYTVDGTTVTVTVDGTDGVGYLVYDEEGNLIGFSNSHKFELSPEAAAKLIAGTATIKAIGSDQSEAKVTNTVRDGSVAEKKKLLKQLIDLCDQLIANSDNTGTKVGYIYTPSCASLQALRNEAYALWETADETKGKDLTDKHLALSEMYYNLVADESARVPFIPGASYRLVNKLYPTKTLTIGSTNCASAVINAYDTVVPLSQRWIFEPVSEGNTKEFYLRNMKDGRYIGTTKHQSTELPLVEQPQSYTFITIAPGTYAFAPDNQTSFGIHIDAGSKVVQWNTTSTGTNWMLIRIDSPEYVESYDELNEMLLATDALLQEAGAMEKGEGRTMQLSEDCFYSNAPYTATNNSDKFHSWSVLYDNNTDTYFHSDYSGKDSKDHLDHYIRIMAPGDETFRYFSITYINRSFGASDPKTVRIEASYDANMWTDVYEATGLKTGPLTENTIGEIVAPTGTKYIRFMATLAGENHGGHPIFTLAELSIKNRTSNVFKPNASFSDMTPELMEALYNQIVDARLAIASLSATQEDLERYIQQLTESTEILHQAMSTFTLAISNVGYATYYNDKATRLPNGLKAGIITETETEKGNDLVIDYRYDGENAVIPANTGVLLKGTEGSYSCPLVSDNTDEAPQNNLLHGSVISEETKGEGKFYKLTYDKNGQNLGFYWGAENGGAFINGAHKAYLALPATMNARSNALILDDVATAIERQSAHSARIVDVYSVSGQVIRTQVHAADALNELPKGVYIIDGKKHIVK